MSGAINDTRFIQILTVRKIFSFFLKYILNEIFINIFSMKKF